MKQQQLIKMNNTNNTNISSSSNNMRNTPFECPVEECNAMLRNEDDMRAHFAVAHLNKPIQCSLCAYKAQTNQRFKHHCAEEHAEHKQNLVVSRNWLRMFNIYVCL